MLGPYRNLQVWQRAMQFATELYQITRGFPRDEMYGLVSQMRRAAVSITSNIAEGYGRSTNTELIHFLYISLGSSNELETQIILAYNLQFISKEQYELLEAMNNEVNAKLRMLISVRSKYSSTPNYVFLLE